MQTFNHGVLFCYSKTERTLKQLKCKFHFKDEVFGVKASNYYSMNNVHIHKVVSIPLNQVISKTDAIKINGEFYRIHEMQFKDKKKPQSLKLFLVKEVYSYDQ